MLDTLQWIFYEKPFSVMLLACNYPFSFSICLTATSPSGLSLTSLALPSPGSPFHYQHPHPLQILHFDVVLADTASPEAEAWQAERGAGVCVLLPGFGCVCVGVCLPRWGANCRKRHHFTAAGAGMLPGLWNTPTGSSVIPGSWRFHKASAVISG